MGVIFFSRLFGFALAKAVLSAKAWPAGPLPPLL